MNSESVRDVQEIVKALVSERKAKLVFLNDPVQRMRQDADSIASIEKELNRRKAVYAENMAFLANPYPTIDAIDAAIAKQRQKLAAKVNEPVIERVQKLRAAIAAAEEHVSS